MLNMCRNNIEKIKMDLKKARKILKQKPLVSMPVIIPAGLRQAYDGMIASGYIEAHEKAKGLVKELEEVHRRECRADEKLSPCRICLLIAKYKEE